MGKTARSFICLAAHLPQTETTRVKATRSVCNCSVAAGDRGIDLHSLSDFSPQTPFWNPGALPASGTAWLHIQMTA